MVKREYSGSSSSYTSLSCNYCKKPGHIVKNCRRLKYNNEKKSKVGSSTTTVIKTIGDIKNSTIMMVKSEINNEIIALDNNQIKINSESLISKENMFLIDTGVDLNLIKLSAVKNSVPLEIVIIMMIQSFM